MSISHGFVDESIRPDGWYRLTLVHVSVRDIDMVSRSVRSMVPEARRRIHFSSEGDSHRRRILDGMLRLPIRGLTVMAPHSRRSNEDIARRLCIDTMIDEMDRSIHQLVFDSRGPDRDRSDRRVVHEALLRNRRGTKVMYHHRGSRDEPLLALPDAFGWSIGAGGDFARKAALVVRVVAVGKSN